MKKSYSSKDVYLETRTGTGAVDALGPNSLLPFPFQLPLYVAKFPFQQNYLPSAQLMTFRACLGLSMVEETSLRISLCIALVFLLLPQSRLRTTKCNSRDPPPSRGSNSVNAILTQLRFHWTLSDSHVTLFSLLSWICHKHLTCPNLSCGIFLTIPILIKEMPQTYCLLLF